MMWNIAPPFSELVKQNSPTNRLHSYIQTVNNIKILFFDYKYVHLYLFAIVIKFSFRCTNFGFGNDSNFPIKTTSLPGGSHRECNADAQFSSISQSTAPPPRIVLTFLRFCKFLYVYHVAFRSCFMWNTSWKFIKHFYINILRYFLKVSCIMSSFFLIFCESLAFFNCSAHFASVVHTSFVCLSRWHWYQDQVRLSWTGPAGPSCLWGGSAKLTAAPACYYPENIRVRSAWVCV